MSVMFFKHAESAVCLQIKKFAFTKSAVCLQCVLMLCCVLCVWCVPYHKVSQFFCTWQQRKGWIFFFHCDQGVSIFLTKIKCRFLITKFRQKVFFQLFLFCKNWIKKSTFLFELCVREEIHSQGRSSRWEKIHTLGLILMQKTALIQSFFCSFLPWL